MPDNTNGAAKKSEAKQGPHSPEIRGAANAGLFSSQLTTSRSPSPSKAVSEQPQKLELNSPNEMLLYLLIQQVQGVKEELAKANAIQIAMIQHEEEEKQLAVDELKEQEQQDKESFEENIRPFMYS